MLTYASSADTLTSTPSPLWTILVTLISMVGVLVLAYYTTRWLGKRMTVSSSNNIIKIIERVGVGQDKLLVVVKVGEQTMLIGMAGNSITKICDLDASSLPQGQEQKNQNNIFHSALKAALKKELRENHKEDQP